MLLLLSLSRSLSLSFSTLPNYIYLPALRPSLTYHTTSLQAMKRHLNPPLYIYIYPLELALPFAPKRTSSTKKKTKKNAEEKWHNLRNQIFCAGERIEGGKDDRMSSVPKATTMPFFQLVISLHEQKKKKRKKNICRLTRTPERHNVAPSRFGGNVRPLSADPEEMDRQSQIRRNKLSTYITTTLGGRRECLQPDKTKILYIIIIVIVEPGKDVTKVVGGKKKQNRKKERKKDSTMLTYCWTRTYHNSELLGILQVCKIRE